MVRDPGVTLLDAKDSTDAATLKSRLDAIYPETSRGDASVIRVGRSFFIFNSWENENKTQDYELQLGSLKLQGEAHAQSYVVGLEKETQVVMQANNLAGQKTGLRIQSKSQPKYSVKPANALVEHAWNAASATLSLTLQHGQGAATVTIEKGPDGKLALHKPARLIPDPPIELRSFGAEAMAAVTNGIIMRIANPSGNTPLELTYRVNGRSVQPRSLPRARTKAVFRSQWIFFCRWMFRKGGGLKSRTGTGGSPPESRS